MNRIIRVTKKDIAHGKVRFDLCPVAVALSRTLDARVQVYGFCITIERFNPRSVHIVGQVPLAVRRFVRRFDRGDPVEPFSFRLRFKE